MTASDGRFRAVVFGLGARLAKVRSPPPRANFDPRRFRISILARQRLPSSALPLASDVHRGLRYPTSPASSAYLSVVAI